MCKCHEEDFNCNQGRDCPNRMPVQYADDEPYQLRDLFVVTVILLVIGYIAFQPEVSGFVMAIRGML